MDDGVHYVHECIHLQIPLKGPRVFAILEFNQIRI